MVGTGRSGDILDHADCDARPQRPTPDEVEFSQHQSGDTTTKPASSSTRNAASLTVEDMSNAAMSPEVSNLSWPAGL
jgi:hypothetical protein